MWYGDMKHVPLIWCYEATHMPKQIMRDRTMGSVCSLFPSQGYVHKVNDARFAKEKLFQLASEKTFRRLMYIQSVSQKFAMNNGRSGLN